MHSSDSDAEFVARIGGRSATARSVRIVGLPGAGRRALPAMDAPCSRPKFNAMNVEHVASPSSLARFYFFVFPLLAFAHLPLQTYLDFNAVYILIQ